MEEKQLKRCIYCDDWIGPEEELAHTEDGETCHQLCLDTFDAHWADRQFTQDMMDDEDS